MNSTGLRKSRGGESVFYGSHTIKPGIRAGPGVNDFTAYKVCCTRTRARERERELTTRQLFRHLAFVVFFFFFFLFLCASDSCGKGARRTALFGARGSALCTAAPRLIARRTQCNRFVEIAAASN